MHAILVLLIVGVLSVKVVGVISVVILGVIRGYESCGKAGCGGRAMTRPSLFFRRFGIIWEVWTGMGAGCGGGGRVCGAGMEYILGCGIGGKEWGAGIEYIPLGNRRRRGEAQKYRRTLLLCPL